MMKRWKENKRIRMGNEKEDMSNDMSSAFSSNYALSTKPERKQEVHTYIFLAPPLTLTLTDLTFAFQIALDLLWEWLTLFPKWAAFSQIAHLAMIAPPSKLLEFCTENPQHEYDNRYIHNLQVHFKKIWEIFVEDHLGMDTISCLWYTKIVKRQKRRQKWK